MAAPPFVKKAGAPDPNAPPAAPRFQKTSARRRGRRKPGKVAPIQKSMMSSSQRVLAGGGR
jgi:hypothetical protein